MKRTVDDPPAYRFPPGDPGACCGPVRLYTQCRLVRKDDRSEAWTVAWIPSQFAETGRVLRIATMSPPDGWVVVGGGKPKPGRDVEHGVLCECGA